MTSPSSRSADARGDSTAATRNEPAADGPGDRRQGQGSAGAARLYLLVAFILATCGLGLIAVANRSYAPEMYDSSHMGIVADAFSNGQNYAVFDLNINIRKLREEQISRLSLTPSIVILGASQWQEARTDLLPNRHALNAHVHRDYYEDVLGVVEMLVRNDKLPRDLIITVRDRLFTPLALRTDTLWLPGIPYFQDMAKRLSMEPLTFVETQPLQRPRELISLAMLFTNAARWHNADNRPHPTLMGRHTDLDLLRPDGSIKWSDEHQMMFTQDRSRKLSFAHADASRNRPPVIDAKGVEALDKLLTYLGLRGVRVHLAHPPFNPLFFDRVQDSPYMEGLRQVEAVTRELAAKHRLGLVGSFDPADLGCTADMFIDAEHSNAGCLSQLMADIAASIDLPTIAPPPQAVAEVSHGAIRGKRALVASGWMTSESGRSERATTTTPAPAIDTAPAPFSVEPATPPASSKPVVAAAPAEATSPSAAAARTERLRPRRTATAKASARPASTTSSRQAAAAKRQIVAAQRELVWPGDQPRTYR